jgi:hypothetical protein
MANGALRAESNADGHELLGLAPVAKAVADAAHLLSCFQMPHQRWGQISEANVKRFTSAPPNFFGSRTPRRRSKTVTDDNLWKSEDWMRQDRNLVHPPGVWRHRSFG